MYVCMHVCMQMYVYIYIYILYASRNPAALLYASRFDGCRCFGFVFYCFRVRRCFDFFLYCFQQPTSLPYGSRFKGLMRDAKGDTKRLWPRGPPDIISPGPNPTNFPPVFELFIPGVYIEYANVGV